MALLCYLYVVCVCAFRSEAFPYDFDVLSCMHLAATLLYGVHTVFADSFRRVVFVYELHLVFHVLCILLS